MAFVLMIHCSPGQLQWLYSLRGAVARIEAGKQQAMTVGWELFCSPFKEAIIGINFKDKNNKQKHYYYASSSKRNAMYCSKSEVVNVSLTCCQGF